MQSRSKTSFVDHAPVLKTAKDYARSARYIAALAKESGVKCPALTLCCYCCRSHFGPELTICHGSRASSCALRYSAHDSTKCRTRFIKLMFQRNQHSRLRCGATFASAHTHQRIGWCLFCLLARPSLLYTPQMKPAPCVYPYFEEAAYSSAPARCRMQISRIFTKN